MIEFVTFHNFKALRAATLPLGRLTLIVGPNGSGKTTAIQAIQAVRDPNRFVYQTDLSAGVEPLEDHPVEVTLAWGVPCAGFSTVARWGPAGHSGTVNKAPGGRPLGKEEQHQIAALLGRIRLFALDGTRIPVAVTLQPQVELAPDGANLAGVLDQMRDRVPESFEAVARELGRWIPEYDRILFETPAPGQRAIQLRTRRGGYIIPAKNVSQGTLFALVLLTLAYLPEPPPVVCLEEPDHGIHPRLYRDVHDALYRLSYPEEYGEKRAPVQVVATTHSPYLLDMFRDHPEEVVIANKVGNEARFERLSDREDIDEILSDAHLGDVWYSGVLGGVPTDS